MGAHVGLLSVEGIADAQAVLEIHGDSLRLLVGNNLVGEWPRTNAAIETMPDHVRVILEGGDSFVFRAADHWLLVLDLQGRHSHLAIRVAEVRSPAPEKEPRPKSRLLLGWLGLSLGLTSLILVWLSGLVSPVDSGQEAQSATTDPGATITAVVPSTTIAVLSGLASESEETRGMVISITDGDTFRVQLGDSGVEPVRLVGIDAPEPGQPTAAESSALLEELIGGKEVRLVVDKNDRDSFGRLLRYVYVGDTFVNEELVKAGLAVARRYPPDVTMAEVLEAAEAEAHLRGLGVWAVPSTALAAATTVSTTPTPTTKATTATVSPGCHRSYPDFCIPSPPPDLDCRDIPRSNFIVLPPDPHHFDGDNNGIGCES
jgi:micrococcal nuclease